MTEAAVEVGPALFFSLMIITLSFIPVFTLQAGKGVSSHPGLYQDLRNGSGGCAIGDPDSGADGVLDQRATACGTAQPAQPGPHPAVPSGIRGRPAPASGYPRWSIAHPAQQSVALESSWGEFLPPLDEGDLLYMPSALPGLSAQKASELLQRTDRLIRTVPEVASVFGKAGRAESATDPAPLEMFETIVRLKPKSEWRPE